MIGEKGNFVFLNHRTRAAAGADLFVSIHHDSMREYVLATKRDQLAGFSLFVSRNNPHARKSLACASAIGAELRAAGFTPSRYHADPVIGENRPFADEANGVHFYDNLAVGKTALMPSVLVEAGVIVNRHEEKRMLDPQVRAASQGHRAGSRRMPSIRSSSGASARKSASRRGSRSRRSASTPSPRRSTISSGSTSIPSAPSARLSAARSRTASSPCRCSRTCRSRPSAYTDRKMGVNYGLNRVRFTSPVPAGARVRARFTLAKYEPIEGNGVQVTWNTIVEIEGKDKPALVAEWIGRHYY